MKIVGDMGIEELLERHLTETESKEIIAIAVSKIVRPLPLASIDTWFEGTSLSRTMNDDLKSQWISELLDRIGSSDLYRQFSLDLISRINQENSLLYDITSLPVNADQYLCKIADVKLIHPYIFSLTLFNLFFLSVRNFFSDP